MQGNAPMHPGQGPGLSLHDLGETGGSQFVTLLESEMPAHAHTLNSSQAEALERLPPTQMPAIGVGIGMYAAPGALTQLSFNAAAPAGGSLPHNNMQPYLTLNFNIALQGVFPPRT
jgi:microcystin-dependent protein